jgi:hypothetical protein
MFREVRASGVQQRNSSLLHQVRIDVRFINLRIERLEHQSKEFLRIAVVWALSNNLLENSVNFCICEQRR